MELAQHISPAGEWGKVWLAAHWDRRLKQQDYSEADIQQIARSFAEKQSLLSLRNTGHLLLGLCKIFARKCQLFDDDATELRTKLMMAFSAMAARQGAAPGALSAPAGARAGAAGDGRQEPQLALVPEVEVERMQVQSELVMVSGKKHMARLEDITLRAPRSRQEARGPPKGDDAFGAVRGEEMEAALRGLGLPAAPLGGLELPDANFFPAFDTQPLVLFDGAAELGRQALGDAADPLGPAVEMPWMIPPAVDTDMEPAPLELPPDDLDVVDLLLGGCDTPELADADVLPPPVLDGVPEQMAEPPEVPGLILAEPLEALAGAVVPANAAGPLLADVGAGGKKRRGRGYFLIDEQTEISKETYQGYVNDRSAITRKSMHDYTVYLPHNSPSLPNFTTTFTEMCQPLCEGLMWGTEVAEKRRKLTQASEATEAGGALVGGLAEQCAAAADLAASVLATHAACPSPLALAEPPEDAAAAEEMAPLQAPSAADAIAAAFAAPPSRKSDMPPVLTPLLNVMGNPDTPRGLVDGAAPTSRPLMDGAPATPAMTERHLFLNAPASMGAVVTGAMDEEDQSGNAAARVGYSGRTEKMHRFLAREFNEAQAPALSYETMCKVQGAGRRELIAGCFFELLVLKTNGVIGLSQDAPKGDIRISKAKQWSR